MKKITLLTFPLLMFLGACGTIQLPNAGSGVYPYQGAQVKLVRNGCVITGELYNATQQDMRLPWVTVIGLDGNKNTLGTVRLHFDPVVAGGRAQQRGVFPGGRSGLGCIDIVTLAVG